MSCGSAVSSLSPGEMVPRLQQTRVIELVSSTPTGLLWLAEKGSNHQKTYVAEYAPKGGGKAFLRDFKSWYERLKTLPADLLPVLSMVTIVEEHLLLVLEAPGGQSAKKMIEAGRTSMPAPEFMQRLLRLTLHFSEQLSGSAHGWIRPETITINSNGNILLGPPAFTPGEVSDCQIDLRDCAQLAAEWAGIPLRPLDADAEQCKQLRKAEDWALAATIEWTLLCRDRSPQSAGPVIEFLGEAIQVPKGNSEKDLSTALDTLKRLYQRSGSTIIKREVEKTEERLAGVRKASQAEPVPQAVPQPELKPQPQSQPELTPASTQAPTPQASPPQEWQCLNCPRVNSPAAKFCSGCGTARDQQTAQQPGPQDAPPPAPNPSPAPIPPSPPSTKKTGSWVLMGALALCVIFGVYYYASTATLREFSGYLDRQMVVNANGPSAYSVYQKTVRENGPESSAAKSMNVKALPILQKISKDAFDSWYKDSELGKPPERRVPGEMVLTSWDEMQQLQEWLSSILKSPQSNAQFAYARGMAALNRRAWAEARQQFEEALRGQPNWSLALNGLGKAYFGLRQYDMTEKYYRQASEADPSWHFPHANLATLYRDVLRNFEASEREYRAAIQLDPNRPSFHFNLGLLYYMHGKQYWPSACSEFKTSLNLPAGTSISPNEVNIAAQRRDRACKGQ